MAPLVLSTAAAQPVAATTTTTTTTTTATTTGCCCCHRRRRRLCRGIAAAIAHGTCVRQCKRAAEVGRHRSETLRAARRTRPHNREDFGAKNYESRVIRSNTAMNSDGKDLFLRERFSSPHLQPSRREGSSFMQNRPNRERIIFFSFDVESSQKTHALLDISTNQPSSSLQSWQ